MNNKFPNGLISPDYTSERGWFLIKFFIKKRPNWVPSDKVSTKYCFYREIGYTNENGTLVGLGRSWLPINKLSWHIQRKCIHLFNPHPLGVILKELFGNELDFKIISEEINNKCLTPYRNKIEKSKMYKRIISHKEKILAYVEEDIILDDGCKIR